MSKKKVSEATENSVTESKTAPKFTVEQLRPHALDLFGLTQSTYAGATHNLDVEYTVEEMKNHIDKWLKKEVK